MTTPEDASADEQKEQERHSQLVGSLVSVKQGLGNPITYSLVARQENGAALIETLERTGIDELGNVTVALSPEELELSPDNPRRDIPDDELADLVGRAGAALARAEENA